MHFGVRVSLILHDTDRVLNLSIMPRVCSVCDTMWLHDNVGVNYNITCIALHILCNIFCVPSTKVDQVTSVFCFWLVHTLVNTDVRGCPRARKGLTSRGRCVYGQCAQFFLRRLAGWGGSKSGVTRSNRCEREGYAIAWPRASKIGDFRGVICECSLWESARSSGFEFLARVALELTNEFLTSLLSSGHFRHIFSRITKIR